MLAVRGRHVQRARLIVLQCVRGRKVQRQEKPEQLHGMRWRHSAAIDQLDIMRRLRVGQVPAGDGPSELLQLFGRNLQPRPCVELLGLRGGELLDGRVVVVPAV